MVFKAGELNLSETNSGIYPQIASNIYCDSYAKDALPVLEACLRLGKSPDAKTHVKTPFTVR
jgi:hypothetical protein